MFFFERMSRKGSTARSDENSLFLVLFLFLFPISTHLVPHQERRVPLEDPGSRHAHRAFVDLDTEKPRPFFAAEPLLGLRELGKVAEEDVGRGAVGTEGVVLVLADEDDLLSW